MAVTKILKEGETNINTPDIFRFAFHSDYPTFKIKTADSQVFTIAAGSNEGHVDISHNLGYQPIYIANVLKGSYSYQVASDIAPNILVTTSGGAEYLRFYSRLIDSNTLRIGAYTVGGGNVSSTESFTAFWIINIDEF